MVPLFMVVFLMRAKHLTLLIMVSCFKSSLIVVCPLLLFVSCLLGSYSSQIMRVGWDKSLSNSFSVSNGVRQGGVLSFSVHLDGLLQKLADSGVGCRLGTFVCWCCVLCR